MIDGRAFSGRRTRGRVATLALRVAIAAIVPFSAVARSAPTPNASTSQAHPLASKEEMIKDRFARFQDRLFRLREQLAQTEPENAARLGRALGRSGELALGEKLEEITRLLRDAAALDQAADAQANWLAEADRLLNILLEQDANNEERKRELERLQGYREKLSQILGQERGLRSQSAELNEARALSKQLEQAARRLDSLLKRQQGVSRAAQAQSPGDPASKQTGEEQADIARDAQQLAEDLKPLAEGSSAKSDPSVDTARAAAKSAAESTQQASGSMSQAGQQLSQSQPQAARDPQEQAEKALADAKQAIEAAKKALEEKQKSPEQMAGEQREVAKQTGGLSDQMKADASGQSQGQQGENQQGQKQSGGKSGSPSGGKKSPGQKNVEQAEKEMQGASESLDADKPKEATPKQDKAVAELEQAQQELEEAIEQLRKEQREETLKDLEGRFRDMLAKQRPINESTLTLDRLGASTFQRAEELQLADLAASQKTLSETAATCLHILDEEGTTVAFPRVVEQLVEDMTSSAERLSDKDVGLVTQTIQQDIVDTLEQLLEAVKRMQQENEQQGGKQGNSSDKEPPLLPQSAELKLLKASQLRVNNRTVAISEAEAVGNESLESAAAGLRKLARRQAECVEIAKQMRDRAQ